MTVTRPCYCTREQVCRALDIAETARAHAQVDRLIQSAADTIEGCLHWRLYPVTATRFKDWPSVGSPTPWRVWLDEDRLISVTSIVSGGISLDPASYFLLPTNGPPYTHVELNLGMSVSFGNLGTRQRAISILGVWGEGLTSATVATLATSLISSDQTIAISSGAQVGVGDLLFVDNERMLVSDRGWVDTGQTLQTPLASSAADVAVMVTDGSLFARDEVLLLDAERMMIIDVAGNSLIAKRAWDGSVLGSHAASTVYASRSLTVQRGQLGTTATTHAGGAQVQRWLPPPLVNQWAIAETINAIEQERSAYARVIGSGETAIEVRGMGLTDLRDKAITRYGRMARTRAV